MSAGARRPLSRPDAVYPRLPIVVLGSGVTPLGVLRILARDGLTPYVADSTDSLLRRSRWFRPLPDGVSAREDTGLERLLSQLTFDRAVLMPCSDSWVSQVAALPATLRQRFVASVPTPETLERFVDKGAFAALLRDTATPHPYSRAVDVAADLDSVPVHLFESAILKPRDSQRFFRRYGVKAVHVKSRDDAAARWQSLRDAGFSVILQEYVPGPATNHYFVDGFVDRFGRIRATFVRQRLRMYPRDFGNSTSMVSVPQETAAPAVESISALLHHVKYRGMFSAEYKLDPRDGVFKVLEVNARAWWYVDFAARCGVDVCRMAYEDALEQPVADVEHYSVGRRLVFPYPDYFAFRELHGGGPLSAWRWTRSWFGAMQPVFAVRDPMPGLASGAAVIRRFAGTRLRRLLPAAATISSPLG